MGKEGAQPCLMISADGDEEDSAEDPTEQQAVDAAVAARSGSQEQPPPWLEVTTALQFMTDDGRLVFHAVRSHCLKARCSDWLLSSASSPGEDTSVVQLIAPRASTLLMSLVKRAPLFSK